jgi:hypothetical protein
MINVQVFIHKIRSKPFLIGLAVALLLLNAARLLVNYYQDRQLQVESRVALLQQQQHSLEKLDDLRKSVAALEARKEQLRHYLFIGESEERIASAMQITLQEKVSKAHLEPESLRPILRGGDKGEEKKIQDISIKLRLSGDIQGFLDFIAELYRSDSFFLIENFVLKPDRQNKLKILMDLKGFYQLSQEKEA